MKTSEYIAYTQLMGDVYKIFMECFRRPTNDLISRGVSGVLTSAFHSIFSSSIEDDKVQEAIIQLEDAFNSESDIDELRLKFEVDYNRLFVGPGKLIAPPYESVYLSYRDVTGDSRKSSHSTIDPIYILRIKAEYEGNGFFVTRDYKDFHDHIALELEYVAFLYHEAAKALVSEDIEREKVLLLEKNLFLEKHIFRWISNLVYAIQGHSTTGFYEGISFLCRHLIEMDIKEQSPQHIDDI